MNQVKPKAPFLIGIAGGTGSGKTTLAKAVKDSAPSGAVSVICIDSYYRAQDLLPMSERVKVNYDHPDSLEFDLLARHLTQLKTGQPAPIPKYDFATHTRQPGVETVVPCPVVIVEGILSLFDPNLREQFELSVFVHTPAELRLKRRLERDIRERGRTEESVLRQWHDTVNPMHLKYCEPSRHYANHVVNGDSEIESAVRLILAKLC